MYMYMYMYLCLLKPMGLTHMDAISWIAALKGGVEERMCHIDLIDLHEELKVGASNFQHVFQHKRVLYMYTCMLHVL